MLHTLQVLLSYVGWERDTETQVYWNVCVCVWIYGCVCVLCLELCNRIKVSVELSYLHTNNCSWVLLYTDNGNLDDDDDDDDVEFIYLIKLETKAETDSWTYENATTCKTFKLCNTSKL